MLLLFVASLVCMYEWMHQDRIKITYPQTYIQSYQHLLSYICYVNLISNTNSYYGYYLGCTLIFEVTMLKTSISYVEVQDIKCVLILNRNKLIDWLMLQQGRYKRTDLRAVNISRCSMCVIMTTGGHINVDQTLIDNEAILTTLTIKSMFGVNLENRIRAVGGEWEDYRVRPVRSTSGINHVNIWGGWMGGGGVPNSVFNK